MDSPATQEKAAPTPTAVMPAPANKVKVGMRAVGAVLGFVLEVAMLAAFVYWSLRQPGPWDLVFALGIPAVTVVLWGVFLSPRSERRLANGAIRWIALLLFLTAAAALAASGAFTFAALMAGFALAHGALVWLSER